MLPSCSVQPDILMQLTFRSIAIALMLVSTLLLNACGGKSQARTKPVASSTTASASAKPAESDCDALDMASFKVEAALMSVGMGTEMGSMMIADSVDRAQKAIAEVAALKPKDPKVKALQTQYLNLAQAALKPVAPLTKPGNDKALKAVSIDVKAKIKAADDFRKDQIFFGDCEK
jgi:hypothetical protein